LEGRILALPYFPKRRSLRRRYGPPPWDGRISIKKVGLGSYWGFTILELLGVRVLKIPNFGVLKLGNI